MTPRFSDEVIICVFACVCLSKAEIQPHTKMTAASSDSICIILYYKYGCYQLQLPLTLTYFAFWTILLVVEPSSHNLITRPSSEMVSRSYFAYFYSNLCLPFLFQPRSPGKALFDMVCDHLNLTEGDYFGLEYTNHRKMTVSEAHVNNGRT